MWGFFTADGVSVTKLSIVGRHRPTKYRGDKILPQPSPGEPRPRSGTKIITVVGQPLAGVVVFFDGRGDFFFFGVFLTPDGGGIIKFSMGQAPPYYGDDEIFAQPIPGRAQQLKY